MEEQFIALAKEAPWMALAGFLVWRVTSQGATFTSSIQQVSEGIRKTAEVIREIRVQWDADRRMIEELQRQTVAELKDLRAEIKALQR